MRQNGVNLMLSIRTAPPDWPEKYFYLLFSRL